MHSSSFLHGLRSVTAAQPFGKKLAEDEVKFLWLTVPQRVKDEVTDEMWAYACGQALLDPAPNKEIATHIRILTYLYRLRDGMPSFDHGLKQDLPQRMAHGQQFNPQPLPGCLEPPRPEALPPVTNPVLKGLL